ncbi:hypothetical protein PG996_013575 [Apiospora saccharicola]|uniref:Zn(2)-C6 fungal-type domain-containing protein n=1 Tax=Apiospora saccharicola TaxID=335842 RepID=A0ABR1U8L7_9PEZI
MGNPATPSRACSPCRIKRRKCDMGLPGCSQCRRACIDCPGYQDCFSLRFRNQTELTASRPRNKPTKKKEKNAATPLELKRTRNTHAFTSLPIRPEDLGHAYFINSYAPAGSFSYLEKSESIGFDLCSLDTALSAPALLLLSHHYRSPELDLLARAHYAKALKRTNRDLSNPEVATKDSTMLQVMLLSFFEALAFEGRDVPWDWTTHLAGIVQLIHLRGECQLNIELRAEVFETAGPLAALEERLAGLMDPSDVHLRLGNVLGEFASLRVDCNALSSIERIQAALMLDERLGGVLRDLDRRAPFEIFDDAKLPLTPDSSHDASIYYHLYRSERESRQWNLARVLTILMNEFLFDQLSSCRQHLSLDEPLRTRQNMILEASMKKGQSMVSDIMCSVPYALELSNCQSASARYIIYPLACAALSPFASPNTVSSVLSTLKVIASRYGWIQAMNSAESIFQSKDMESWMHLSILY